MKKNDKIMTKLVDILLKKAEGFYADECQFEYKKETPEKKTSKYQNISFFDEDVRGDGEFEKIDAKLKSKSQEEHGCYEGLTLAKKKVTSRYIPPDMFAVKILLEMFGKKEVSDFEDMSDERLLNLKKELLKEIKDEII